MIARAPTGFPALRKLFRDDFPPLLRALDPFLRNLNPLITGLNLYKNEVTSVFANVAAASNATIPVRNEKGENFHYLRVMGPLNPETRRDVQQPPDEQPQQRLQPAALGQGPHLRSPQLRHPPVQLGDYGHAEFEHPQRTRLQRTDRRQRQRSDGLLRTPQTVRLRRPVQHRLRARPRMHPAGALQADLRQRAGNHLPAHVRTDRRIAAADARRRAASRPPFSIPLPALRKRLFAKSYFFPVQVRMTSAWARVLSLNTALPWA